MSGAEIINLENLYLFDGGTKENWDFFSKDINTQSYCQKIMFSIFNYLTTQPKNELTLDIIDYIIDYGCPHILGLCSQKSFLDQIINLLKPETDAGLENQKKAIFLIQKWAKKFANDQNMSIFIEQYNMLKNSGVTFPPDDFVIKTYDKFTGEKKEGNNQINNNANSQQNNMNMNSEPPKSNEQEIKKEEINIEQEQQDGFPPVQNEKNSEFENVEANPSDQQQPVNNSINNTNNNVNPEENKPQNVFYRLAKSGDYVWSYDFHKDVGYGGREHSCIFFFYPESPTTGRLSYNELHWNDDPSSCFYGVHTAFYTVTDENIIRATLVRNQGDPRYFKENQTILLRMEKNGDEIVLKEISGYQDMTLRQKGKDRKDHAR